MAELTGLVLINLSMSTGQPDSTVSRVTFAELCICVVAGDGPAESRDTIESYLICIELVTQ